MSCSFSFFRSQSIVAFFLVGDERFDDPNLRLISFIVFMNWHTG